MSSVLEKELTCSICTDILFDPVTFLDCLHSNCGSCAKSWFDSREHPTCPICREPVREARAHATISSLLEDFLNSNPSKKRTSEDKASCRAIYKPGDSLIGFGARPRPVSLSNITNGPQATRSPPVPPRGGGSLLLNSWGMTGLSAGIGSEPPTPVRFGNNSIQNHPNIQNHPRLFDALPPSCDGCSKSINTLVHYECTGCNLFHLCIDCQRSGTSCRAPGPGHLFHPQRLAGNYQLQIGLFCSMCHEWTDEDRNERQDAPKTFFWHCDTCNDGAWTYCQSCVRKGRCCSHTLTLWTNSRTINSGSRNPSIRGVSQAAVIAGLPRSTSVEPPTAWLQARGYRRWLNYRCKCDICHMYIPGSQTWQHCYTCGNFDTCMRCPHYRLNDPVPESCPNNHPLSILTLDRAQGGTIRPIKRPRVRCPDVAQGHPREGTAVRGLWPREIGGGLSFPKGADISNVYFAFEADGMIWWWGCYAGSSGFFEDRFIELEEEEI
ncbi:hypothetical protein EDC01DRAFT_611603 [Geopyxis carbonaria]|nr:hypothetical protein EDC01DRAFT_611603 [Geopyxis carbonaria]